VQINDILQDALKVFDGRLNDISLRHDLAAELPIVQADSDQMKRVVGESDRRERARSAEQSLRKEIWVRSTLSPDRDLVEIIIEDSGPGIPPEDKERLFPSLFLHQAFRNRSGPCHC